MVVVNKDKIARIYKFLENSSRLGCHSLKKISLNVKMV